MASDFLQSGIVIFQQFDGHIAGRVLTAHISVHPDNVFQQIDTSLYISTVVDVNVFGVGFHVFIHIHDMLHNILYTRSF